MSLDKVECTLKGTAQVFTLETFPACTSRRTNGTLLFDNNRALCIQFPSFLLLIHKQNKLKSVDDQSSTSTTLVEEAVQQRFIYMAFNKRRCETERRIR